MVVGLSESPEPGVKPVIPDQSEWRRDRNADESQRVSLYCFFIVMEPSVLLWSKQSVERMHCGHTSSPEAFLTHVPKRTYPSVAALFFGWKMKPQDTIRTIMVPFDCRLYMALPHFLSTPFCHALFFDLVTLA